MTYDTLIQALTYASRGWPVFPCKPDQKIPATRHGYRDATTDPERITPVTGNPVSPRWQGRAIWNASQARCEALA